MKTNILCNTSAWSCKFAGARRPCNLSITCKANLFAPKILACFERTNRIELVLVKNIIFFIKFNYPY